jgi:hypothetical protein
MPCLSDRGNADIKRSSHFPEVSANIKIIITKGAVLNTCVGTSGIAL